MHQRPPWDPRRVVLLPLALWATLLSVGACDAPTPSGGAEAAGGGASTDSESTPEEPTETVPEPADEPAVEPADEPAEPPPSPIALGPLEAFGSADAMQTWVDGLTRRAARSRRSTGEGRSGLLNNVQERGVDEGGIVHRAGDYLVVLRRGRLYTVRVADDRLEPVARIDVPAPGRSRRWDWYDEMLVADGTVLVIGYSYARNGTELLLFDLAADGTLSRGPRYRLRSNDYYSSRNYASRLIGDELILYAAFPFASPHRYRLPSIRAEGDESWRPLLAAADVLRPVQHLDLPMLHTVIRCAITERPMRCRARGIVGPRTHSFYVSDTAVYAHVREPRWWRRQAQSDQADAVIYRWPHDGSALGAVRTWGSPIDQLSFLERGPNLFVAVREGASSSSMWGSRVTRGALEMTHIPLAALSGGLGEAPRSWLTELPRPGRMSIQNRFVEGHYLYGQGTGWFGVQRERAGHVYVHRLGEATTDRVELGHSVDRIEDLGGRALVVGSGGGDLTFSVLGLSEEPSVTGRFVQAGASQGETRTHGFFFRDDGDGRGVLGLPVRSRRGGWRQLFQTSAAVVYLGVRGPNLAPLGALQASPGRERDRCRASCADWYGNSRPLFLEGRVFALLGYDLVEGAMSDEHISERRRTNLFRDAE